MAHSLEYLINKYMELNPEFDVTAAEHLLGCACPSCICLAHTAAQLAEPDDLEDWHEFVSVTESADPTLPVVPDRALDRYRLLIENF